MTTTLTPEAHTISKRSSSIPSVTSSEARPQLAIFGGPMAVTARYRERFRRTGVMDVVPLLSYLVRGKNTAVAEGPITKFEDRFARLCDTRYAILMNSGTATLHSAYVALGVKPGDEVLVPTYTWFATAAPVLQCGATPVFCDIDPQTLTMDPIDTERRITSRTKAICVVHIWGNPAELDKFVDLTRRFNLALIEDASHAHGAMYDGRPVGGWGDIGCFSLQGTKAVSGGEAGVVVTNDPFCYDRMLALGHNLRREEHVTKSIDVDEMSLGFKYRPHLCAAVLANASLSRLDRLNQLRGHNYDILIDELSHCPALETIERYPKSRRGGYLEFPIRYRKEEAGNWPREAFVQAARAEGVHIDPDRYTNVSSTSQLLHECPLFNSLDVSHIGGPIPAVNLDHRPRDTRLPVAERLATELLSMPPFTDVKVEFVRQQARAMCKVVNAARQIRDFRYGV